MAGNIAAGLAQKADSPLDDPNIERIAKVSVYLAAKIAEEIEDHENADELFEGIAPPKINTVDGDYQE
jgi:type VI protein secretion system component VasA